MPLIITYKDGQKEVVVGESIREFFDQGFAGKSLTQTIDGFDRAIVRDDIRGVTLVPLKKWEERAAEGKKQQEQQAKDEAAAREAARIDQAWKVEADRLAQIAAAEAKKPLAWIKRILRLTPKA